MNGFFVAFLECINRFSTKYVCITELNILQTYKTLCIAEHFCSTFFKSLFCIVKIHIEKYSNKEGELSGISISGNGQPHQTTP